jgi:hypothetical protein
MVNTKPLGPGGYRRSCYASSKVTKSGIVTVRRERSVFGAPAIRCPASVIFSSTRSRFRGKFEAIDPQADEFREAQRRVGGDQDEHPPPIGHRLDEPLEFLARQGAWLVVFDLRQLDPARGVRRDLPRLGGSPEDHAEDLHGVLRPPRARSGLHDRVDVGAGDRVQRSSPEVRFDVQAPQLVVGDQAAAGAAPNRTTLGNQQALLGGRVYRGSSGRA